MRTIDVIQGNSNRNQSLRLLMLFIIVGTFPFYCMAVVIIGSAPVEVATSIDATQTLASAPSFTPLGADRFLSPTASGLPALLATNTPLSLQQRPTPVQFVPPTAIPAQTIVAQTIVSPSPTEQSASSTPLPTRTAGPADVDGDGVPDSADSCPDEYGFDDNQGCPYPDDPDRDGVRSGADLCPNEFAPESPRGCRDFDDDGLDSSVDDCPHDPGPSSNNGCPLHADAGG